MIKINNKLVQPLICRKGVSIFNKNNLKKFDVSLHRYFSYDKEIRLLESKIKILKNKNKILKSKTNINKTVSNSGSDNTNKNINKHTIKKNTNGQNRGNELIHNTGPVFKNILVSLLAQNNIKFDIIPCIEKIITFHNNLIINHGVVDGTKRYNNIRLYSIHLLEGLNPDNPGWLATGRKDR